MKPLPRVIRSSLYVLAPVLVGAELILFVVRQWPYAVPADPASRRARADAVLAGKCAGCHAADGGFNAAEREFLPGSWNQLDVVCDGRGPMMPPLRSRLVSWGSWLSPSDRAVLRAEGAACRHAYFGAMGLPADGRSALVPLPPILRHNQGRALLGRDLFLDRRLSGDGTLSCSDCHRLGMGGADGRPRSVGAKGRIGAFNTPSVYNAAISCRQFWDGRATNLAEQALGSLLAPDQMDGGSLTGIVARLSSDARLAARFAANYETGLVGSNVVDAIVQYENTLLTPRNAFDRDLNGRPDALSAAARRGKALFLAAACDACHGGPALGGLSIERPDRAAAARFKVPTLRNVALTAPYWHDGSVTNLAEAVRRMGSGTRNRRFSEAECADLAALLDTF